MYQYRPESLSVLKSPIQMDRCTDVNVTVGNKVVKTLLHHIFPETLPSFE